MIPPSVTRRDVLRGIGCGVAASLLQPLLRGQPAPSGRPNVLFIAVDDLRPELPCYGAAHIKAPHISRLASQGTVFAHAYCQQAVCSPSRTSLLTGLRPDSTRVYDLDTHFRNTVPDVVTLPQHFKAHGYFTQDEQDLPRWPGRPLSEVPWVGAVPTGASPAALATTRRRTSHSFRARRRTPPANGELRRQLGQHSSSGPVASRSAARPTRPPISPMSRRTMALLRCLPPRPCANSRVRTSLSSWRLVSSSRICRLLPRNATGTSTTPPRSSWPPTLSHPWDRLPGPSRTPANCGPIGESLEDGSRCPRHWPGR